MLSIAVTATPRSAPLSDLTARFPTTLQIDALNTAGASKIYQEKRSSVGERPALPRLLQDLQPGDVVLVYKVDRFARSLMDLLGILERIERAQATFRSLTEPIAPRPSPAA